MKLTKKQARLLILSHQKLLTPRQLLNKEDIIQYIKNVGCIQFDPLNVIAYNPYLVLQSRVKNFRGDQLQALLYEDRKLLDGWDKCMSIYPVEDWPYFQRFRDKALTRHGTETSPIYEILPSVRNSLLEKGPLSSKDLNLNTKVDWAWAPTRASRAALESMHFWGELIIHHKIGTRKVYDFAENNIPQHILSLPDPNATLEEYHEWIVKRRVGSIGLLWNKASDAWLGIDSLKSADRNMTISNLEDKGELLRVEVEDIDYPFYIRKEEEALLHEILNNNNLLDEIDASFIAPLDNLLWDRKLIKELFDFDYKWEVYTPVVNRKYGYYVLPILCGDRFIGRLEPRYNRKSNTLEILNCWWEKDINPEDFTQPLVECLNDFKDFLGASTIHLINDSKTLENMLWLQDFL